MKSIRLSGLLLAAVLATAVLPATASAAIPTGGIQAESYPASLSGQTIGFLGFPATKTIESCDGPNLSGSISGPSENTKLAVSLKCGANTASMNGCQFEVHAGSLNTIDIGPAGCGPITGLKVGSCSISIPAQAGIPAEFTTATDSIGNKAVQVDVNAAIKYSSSCTGELKLIFGIALAGQNQAKEAIDLETADGFNAIFLGTQQFKAESYPLSARGEQKATAPFTMVFPGAGISEVICATADLSAQLSGASSSLALGSTFGGCASSGSPVTVKMNNCNFNAIFNSLTLTCANTGEGIEFVHSSCTIRVPPQTFSAFWAYTTVGLESTRYLSAGGGASSNVTYQNIAGFCTFLGGSNTDGTLKGWSFDLYGT